MKKFLLAFILVFSLLATSTVNAAAAPKVYVNNEEVKFANKPIVQNGTTMVPFRNLLESLNANVDYNTATKTITASTANITVKLVLGEKVAVKNGEIIQLSVAPYVKDGVTYVPLRFLSQSLDYAVDYKNNTIYIATSSNTPAASGKNLTTEEIGKQSNRVAFIETYDSTGKLRGTGSGVSIAEGIITNYHVISGASKAIVYLDNNKYETNVILKYDTKRDLALLQLNKANLPVIKIGDSTQVKQGEAIVTIGSPLGYSNTLSTGIVSNPLREVEGQPYIQISAPIDHGSSGGALFNMKGELVGLTTWKVDSSANLNFAIPSSSIKTFLNQANNQITMEVLSNTVTDIMTAYMLDDYLNYDLDYIYNGYIDLDLYWDVMISDDEPNYLAVANIFDYEQFIVLHQALESGGTSMEDLYRFILQDVQENMGIKNLSVMFVLEAYWDFTPDNSLVDSDFYSFDGEYYDISFPFSIAERDGNKFIYYTNPLLSDIKYSANVYQ